MAGAISVTIALHQSACARPPVGLSRRLHRRADSRITDAISPGPFLILAIALAAFLGPASQRHGTAIGISGDPTSIRLTRGQVMSVKVEDYVEAARAMGNPRWRIAWSTSAEHHAGAAWCKATLSIAAAIIAEAALSFSASASQPPLPSLGQHAQRRAQGPDQFAVDGDLAGLAIFLVCCRSTSSATACARAGSRER